MVTVAWEEIIVEHPSADKAQYPLVAYGNPAPTPAPELEAYVRAACTKVYGLKAQYRSDAEAILYFDGDPVSAGAITYSRYWRDKPYSVRCGAIHNNAWGRYGQTKYMRHSIHMDKTVALVGMHFKPLDVKSAVMYSLQPAMRPYGEVGEAQEGVFAARRRLGLAWADARNPPAQARELLSFLQELHTQEYPIPYPELRTIMSELVHAEKHRTDVVRRVGELPPYFTFMRPTPYGKVESVQVRIELNGNAVSVHYDPATVRVCAPGDLSEEVRKRLALLSMVEGDTLEGVGYKYGDCMYLTNHD